MKPYIREKDSMICLCIACKPLRDLCIAINYIRYARIFVYRERYTN
jgi:hypothetical protein